VPLWLAAAATGGALGAFAGSRRLPEAWMRRILAALLLASGLELIVG
jgi:uncharacterized protein